MYFHAHDRFIWTQINGEKTLVEVKSNYSLNRAESQAIVYAVLDGDKQVFNYRYAYHKDLEYIPMPTVGTFMELLDKTVPDNEDIKNMIDEHRRVAGMRKCKITKYGAWLHRHMHEYFASQYNIWYNNHKWNTGEVLD